VPFFGGEVKPSPPCKIFRHSEEPCVVYYAS
jgi:hypothetical protein